LLGKDADMIRRALAIVFVAVLVSPRIRAEQAVTGAGAPQSPTAAIESPTYVLVRLKDGTGIRGYLVQVTADALHVRARPESGTVRMLPVTDVITIERQERGKVVKAVGKTVLITGAVIGLTVLSVWAGLSAE
jgi:hypothetical protein